VDNAEGPMAKKRVAVVGLGAMGSSTVSALARDGEAEVFGFERFQLGHERSSHHGETRAIRMAYFEGSFYVDLLRLAFDKWDELQSSSSDVLFNRVKALEGGFPGSDMVDGILEADEKHQLGVERLTNTVVRERYPQFEIPSDWTVVLEHQAGYLRPELIIKKYVEIADKSQANLQFGCPVLAIEPRGSGVALHLMEDGRRSVKEFDSVVLTAGPWMKDMLADLLPELAAKLKLTRQVSAWFESPQRNNFNLESEFPVFALQTQDDIFYGFPDVTGQGVKISSHKVGDEFAHPVDRDDTVTDADIEPLLNFAKTYLPGAVGPTTHRKSCTYTNSHDGHFFIGLHPRYPQIVLASPCSGHGFKFASIFGPVLAELAMTGTTKYQNEIKEFRLDRTR